jgi:hypothetical protein
MVPTDTKSANKSKIIDNTARQYNSLSRKPTSDNMSDIAKMTKIKIAPEHDLLLALFSGRYYLKRLTTGCTSTAKYY